jgi:hypothetical protein
MVQEQNEGEHQAVKAIVLQSLKRARQAFQVQHQRLYTATVKNQPTHR